MVTLTTTSILPAATLYMNREKLLIYAVEGRGGVMKYLV